MLRQTRQHPAQPGERLGGTTQSQEQLRVNPRGVIRRPRLLCRQPVTPGGGLQVTGAPEVDIAQFDVQRGVRPTPAPALFEKLCRLFRATDPLPLAHRRRRRAIRPPGR